jgi:hypothetical protein
MAQVAATEIFEFAMLQIGPNAFSGVQVWHISRQALQPEPLCCTSGPKSLDALTAMKRGAIPEDEQLARDQAKPWLQKGKDGGAVESLGLQSQLEFTRWCKGADDRSSQWTQATALPGRKANRRRSTLP